MDIQRFVAHVAQCSHAAQRKHPANCTSDAPSQLEIVPEGLLGSVQTTQLLNAAVGSMTPGEVYCEIGCLPGTHLVAALLNHPDCMAYAVEDSASVEAQPEAIDQFTEKLATSALEEQVFFCCQSFEEFFHDLQQLASDDRIGVYFYHGKPDYRSVILGLMLAAPFLAEEAVIMVGQAALGTVRQATWDFLAAYPQAILLSDATTQDGSLAGADEQRLVLGWQAVESSRTEPFDWQQHRDRSVIEAIYHLPAHHTSPLHRDELDLETLHKEAVQLHFEGHLTEAEAKYRTLLQADPQNAETWSRLGMLYHLAQNDEAALEALQHSLTLQTENALAHHVSGLVLERMNRTPEAIASYQQAIALNAAHLDTCHRLGDLLIQNGELGQAEALARQSIAAEPQAFGGYLRLGNALMAQQKAEPAIAAYRQALTLKHRDPIILHKIGEAYAAAGDLANARNFFAYSLARGGDAEAAIEEFKAAFALATGTVGDYLTLSDCYQRSGQIEAASECIHTAAKMQPEDALLKFLPETLLPLFYQNVEEIATYYQRFEQGLKAINHQVELVAAQQEMINFASIFLIEPFYLAYQAINVRELLSLYGQLLQRLMRESHPDWFAPLAMPVVSETGKIRIGYLAESIGANSMSRWALGWLQHHDRSQFEIYCYNTGSYSDHRTEQFKALSDVYRYIPNDLPAVSQQILDDNLHVLVYLAVGTYKPTAANACLRLAPVQCNTWGHPVTSGISEIDYYLSGTLIEPENAQEHYTEELVRLPNLGISYPQPIIPAPTKTRADFGFSAEAVLYISCQLLIKYLPQHDSLFAAIAQRVPQAKFVFIVRSTFTLTPSQTLERQFRLRLQQAFAAVGLDSNDYCVFLPGQCWQDYTSLLLDADAFLDTPDFSGGHTTFDAIACNLPVVSHVGEFMRGRQSCGMLTMMGITDTIAHDEAEYVEIAVRLGLEPEWRQSIAQQMSERQQRLFDDTDCVKGLEQFYHDVVATKLAEQGDTLPVPMNAQPATKRVLHVGCGPYNPGALPEQLRTSSWQEVRLDINPDVKPDLIGSMTDMSAVLDESVDAVFSSHNLEHLYAHEVPLALAEFHRVLKPGGFALITLPDIQAVAEHVAQGNLEETLYVSPAGPISALDILYGLRTAVANGNHFMAHRTAFTAKTLAQKLEKTGFQRVECYQETLNLWARGYK